MEPHLLTLNSLVFKEITINISPSIPKQSLGNTIWEFPGDSKEGERLESKNGQAPEAGLERNWGETMTEFAIRGPLCIRAEGLCGLLQRTDRAVSMKPISVQHKEREAWGGAPQESLSIFQMLPICYRYWRLAFLKPMGSHWNQMTFIDAQEKKKSSVVKLLWETCPLCDIHHSIY